MPPRLVGKVERYGNMTTPGTFHITKYIAIEPVQSTGGRSNRSRYFAFLNIKGGSLSEALAISAR